MTNDALKKVHEYVTKIKVLPEVKKEYMKFEEIIYYERKEAAEEAAEQAAKETKLEAILDLLSDHGKVPDDLRKRIEQEKDQEILRKWLKLSARVDSMEEFKERMNSIK